MSNEEWILDITRKNAQAIEELSTLSDEELKKIFPEYTDMNDILNKCPVGVISERIEKYTEQISGKTATTVMTTTAVKFDGSENDQKDFIPDVVTLGWLLTHDEGYSDKEFESLTATEHPKGIVLWYDYRRSMGFLFRQHKGTIHKISITKEGMSNTLNSRLHCGDIVKFTPYRTEKGHVCARDVKRIGHVQNTSKPIELPGGSQIRPVSVWRYGLANAMNQVIYRSNGKITAQTIEENGYHREDFDYIFIRTNGGMEEYRIYSTSSPIKGDGQVENIYEFMKMLDQKILAFTYAPGLVKTKEMRLSEKEVKENKDELAHTILWYRTRLEAELIWLGFDKSEAKAMIGQFNIDKKIKKHCLELSVEGIKKTAKMLSKKKSPAPNADGKARWFRLVVLSELLKSGLYTQDCKDIMNSSGFNSFLNGKKWTVLKEMDPKKVAEEILCKKFFHI